MQLLQDMDRIAELWPQLAAAGMDLRPEAGRWETIQAHTHRQARSIVRELRRSGGLPALRSRRNGGTAQLKEPSSGSASGPAIGQDGAAEAAANANLGQGESSQAIVPVLSWWWYLDREVHEADRRRRILRLASISASGRDRPCRQCVFVPQVVPRRSEAGAGHHLPDVGPAEGRSAAGFCQQARWPISRLRRKPSPTILSRGYGLVLCRRGYRHGAEAQEAFRRARTNAGTISNSTWVVLQFTAIWASTSRPGPISSPL